MSEPSLSHPKPQPLESLAKVDFASQGESLRDTPVEGSKERAMSSEPGVDAFMSRVGIDSDQFDTVAGFFGIMTEETIDYRAKGFDMSRASLEEMRHTVFDTFIGLAKLLDQASIENTGSLPVTISERGVGYFNHTQMTRAAISVLNGTPAEEAAERAETTAEVLEIVKEIITTRLLHMAVEAVKSNPEWTALDILKSFSVLEEFGEWHEKSLIYEEDEDPAEGN